MFYIFNFFIGSCIASHALVISEAFDNPINSRNPIWGRSRCSSCYKELSLADEIPILSFLFLKGKCRYCASPIPTQLLIFEFIGGVTFIEFDFSDFRILLDTIFIFSILVTAISDWNTKSFESKILVTPAIIALINFIENIRKINISDLISILIIGLLMIFYIRKNKLGLGDLLIYLLVALNYSSTTANLMLLIGSFLILIWYISKPNSSHKLEIPMIPFLFCSLIIALKF